MEMRLIRDVQYNDTFWFIHLCRLTGYNADSESTEDQGICFKIDISSEIIVLSLV